MRVVQPSYGANHFHLLREHAYSTPRQPLVVFSPKQLLRLRAAASKVQAFTQGRFMPVVPDDTATNSAKQVLLVSGRLRSEERRVGKECRAGGARSDSKRKIRGGVGGRSSGEGTKG